ncbi:MAG: asparagine synthase [Microbacterium sp.]|uniref:asparagine synthase n=1 Tax=Microbacterium sp. TaxID=51671 RepID=UPI0039E55173
MKNVILVETIGRGHEYDVEALLPRARDVLLGLAGEQWAAAHTVRQERKKAKGKFGDPNSTHDYLDRDMRNLRKREKQYTLVAEDLQEQAEDEDVLRQIIDESREWAWEEVERNLERRLATENVRADDDPDYDELRQERMSAVVSSDLKELRKRARKLKRKRKNAGDETVS